jgi:hypothetical protein
MSSQDNVKDEEFEIINPQAGGQPSAAGAGEPTGPLAEPQEPVPNGSSPGASAEGEAEGQPVTVDVYTLLRISIAQLTSIAWQMMGLQPDPFTNQVRKDIAQARVAIDAAAALVEQLKPHLHGQEARDYQALLTDLRLNFVSHSAEQPGGQ